MNRCKFYTIAGLLVIGMASSALAQTTNKFGHINSTELLAMMPEIKAADATLKEYGSQLESQLKTMSTEYQSKIADYQAKEATMPEAVKQAKQKEIVDLEGRIQQFQQTAQEDVTRKKQELYDPILKKAEDAIVVVAKENGFAYIFDKGQGGLIYAQDSDDITPLVKKKLGLL